MAVITYATIEELTLQHNGEWVLLDEPVVDDQGWVIGGIPLAFASEPASLNIQSLQLALRDAAVLLLGDWTGDEEFILLA